MQDDTRLRFGFTQDFADRLVPDDVDADATVEVGEHVLPAFFRGLFDDLEDPRRSGHHLVIHDARTHVSDLGGPASGIHTDSVEERQHISTLQLVDDDLDEDSPLPSRRDEHLIHRHIVRRIGSFANTKRSEVGLSRTDEIRVLLGIAVPHRRTTGEREAVGHNARVSLAFPVRPTVAGKAPDKITGAHVAKDQVGLVRPSVDADIEHSGLHLIRQVRRLATEEVDLKSETPVQIQKLSKATADLFHHHVFGDVEAVDVQYVGHDDSVGNETRRRDVAHVHGQSVVHGASDDTGIFGFPIDQEALDELATVAVHVLREHLARPRRVADDVHERSREIVLHVLPEDLPDIPLGRVHAHFSILAHGQNPCSR